MFKVKVTGIYQSDTGTGQAKFINFEYEFVTSRPVENGLKTHIQNRYIPYLIANDKKKTGVPFSKLNNFFIESIEEVEENEKSIIGKDITKLDDWQLQDLAAAFDLYEVPVYGHLPLKQTQEKAALAYMKKVLNVPMKTNKEKDMLDCFVKQADGVYKFVLENAGVDLTIFDPGYFHKKKQNKKETLKLSDFIEKAKQKMQGIFSDNSDESDELNNENSDFEIQKQLFNKDDSDIFPNQNELV